MGELAMKPLREILSATLAIAIAFILSPSASAITTRPNEGSISIFDSTESDVADLASEALTGSTDTIVIEPGDPSEQGVIVSNDTGEELLIQDAHGGSTVRIGLPVAEDVEPRVTEYGDVVFDATQEGAQVLVQELDVTNEPLLQAAARAVFTIESYDVDPLFAMDLDIPGAVEITQNDDGSVTFTNSNSDILAYIGAPWALDAAGESVATWYEIEDGKLYQYVDHLAREHVYPIVADPPFLIPVLLVGGRIIIQRIVAATAATAARNAISTVARTGVKVVGEAKLKSFTASNYRHNLIVWTSRIPDKKCDAHHTLPQKFRVQFENSGFKGDDSIDHPKYLVWWDSSDHRAKSAAINKEWGAWWGTKTKDTKTKILTQRTAVLRKYPPVC